MRRRTIPAPLALWAIAIALVLACGGGDSTSLPAAAPATPAAPAAAPGVPEAAPEKLPGAPVKVELQLNWKPEPQFGGFYAAQVGGAYAERGLEVEIRPGGASAPTVDMLGAGTVPFAIVSGDEIVRSRANGNLIVALFAAYHTNPQGIMTRAERGFGSLDDLFEEEGTLAIERGLPYAAFLERKYGFEKLRIVPSPFGDLSLYRTDPRYAMQCFVTAEPLQAKKTGIEPETFLIASTGFNPYTTVLATSESYLKANPKVVEAMVYAVRQGWQSYLEDPMATNQLMHQLNPTMDLETFAASAEAQKRLVEPKDGNRYAVGAMTLSRWRQLVDQLVGLGVVPEAIPPEQCFVP